MLSVLGDHVESTWIVSFLGDHGAARADGTTSIRGGYRLFLGQTSKASSLAFLGSVAEHFPHRKGRDDAGPRVRDLISWGEGIMTIVRP
jgi:hypothetical protein